MKRRGNVEFVAAKESGLVQFLGSEKGLIIDRPIDDGEFFFLFESEGCESDDLGRFFGAN